MKAPYRQPVRWLIVAIATTAVLAAPLVGLTQPPRARIGMLELSTPDPARVAWWDAFRQRVRELGYIEGQNVTFDARFADGRIERLPALAAELVKMKVDVIVTGSNAAALAAKGATTTIPIVMATGADQVGLGIVAGFARPGGNVTGITSLAAELNGKRLALLKDVAPRLSRAAFLTMEDNPGSAASIREIHAAVGPLGLVVTVVSVRPPYDFDSAFSGMVRDRAEGVIVQSINAYFGDRKRIADLTLKHRLPSVGGGKEYADAGLLLVYGASYPDLFRRVAVLVDKILKGAKPADLPFEQPTKFELVVNLKTAKALGIKVPQSILVRAEHVIQ